MESEFLVAIHESGHVVSACLFGIPVKYVTIVPVNRPTTDDNGFIRDTASLGRTQIDPCYYKNVIYSTKWRNESSDYYDIICREAMFNCAGCVAEFLEFGYPSSFIDQPDFRDCQKLLTTTLNEKNPDFTIQRLYDKTKVILGSHMRIVESLAQYLVLEKSLTGKECLFWVALHRGIKVDEIQQYFYRKINI